MFRLRQRALQQFGKQLAESRVIQALHVAQLDPGKIGRPGVLADEVEKVIARRLNELGAEEDIVVDVVDADGQRSHRNRDAIALELDSGRFRQPGREDS